MVKEDERKLQYGCTVFNLVFVQVIFVTYEPYEVHTRLTEEFQCLYVIVLAMYKLTYKKDAS